MGTCIKTTLAAAVTNDKLLKVGEVRLKYLTAGASGNALRISLRSSPSQVITALDGNLDFGGNSTFTISTSWPTTVYNGEGMFSIPNKYDLLTLQGCFDKFNLSDFIYSKNISQMVLPVLQSGVFPTDCDIDLTLLSEFPALADFRINQAYKNCVYGNLDSLYGNESITTFMITNALTGTAAQNKFTNLKATMRGLGGIKNLSDYNWWAVAIGDLTGSIEDFVTAKRDVGATTKTVTFKWIQNGNITWKGNTFPNDTENCTISWTDNTITFRGETINA